MSYQRFHSNHSHDKDLPLFTQPSRSLSGDLRDVLNEALQIVDGNDFDTITAATRRTEEDQTTDHRRVEG
jgi:hypothetical protein